MAERIVRFTDDFTGPSGPLEEPNHPYDQLNRNRSRIDVSSSLDSIYTTIENWGVVRYSSDITTADQYARVEVGTHDNAAGQQHTGVVLRAQGTVNQNREYYEVRYQYDGSAGPYTTTIGYCDGDVLSVLWSGTVAWQVGDWVEGEIIGDQIRLLRNGTEIQSVNDTNLTDGRPGIVLWGRGSTRPYIVNFEMGDLVAGPPPVADVFPQPRYFFFRRPETGTVARLSAAQPCPFRGV